MREWPEIQNFMTAMFIARWIAEDRGIELQSWDEILEFLTQLEVEGIYHSPGPIKTGDGESFGFQFKFLPNKWKGPSLKQLSKTLPRIFDFYDLVQREYFSRKALGRPNSNTPFSLN